MLASKAPPTAAPSVAADANVAASMLVRTPPPPPVSEGHLTVQSTRSSARRSTETRLSTQINDLAESLRSMTTRQIREALGDSGESVSAMSREDMIKSLFDRRIRQAASQALAQKPLAPPGAPPYFFSDDGSLLVQPVLTKSGSRRNLSDLVDDFNAGLLKSGDDLYVTLPRLSTAIHKWVEENELQQLAGTTYAASEARVGLVSALVEGEPEAHDATNLVQQALHAMISGRLYREMTVRGRTAKGAPATVHLRCAREVVPPKDILSFAKGIELNAPNTIYNVIHVSATVGSQADTHFYTMMCDVESECLAATDHILRDVSVIDGVVASVDETMFFIDFSDISDCDLGDSDIEHSDYDDDDDDDRPTV